MPQADAPTGAIMTEPHPHRTAPGTAQGNVDIDVDIDVDSNVTAPKEGPAQEPALTTSEDAQRDDLLVQPGNS
jgi:hypothetical protein